MVRGSKRRVSRRQAIKAATAASTVLIAGCGGGGDGEGGDGGGGGGDGAGGGGGGDGDGGGGGGGGDGGGDGGDGEDERQVVDTPLRAPTARQEALTTGEMNPFNPNSEAPFRWLLQSRMGSFSYTHGEFNHLDTVDWEFDEGNDEMRVQLKDGIVWHQDGEELDEFTGEHAALHHKMQREMTRTAQGGELEFEPLEVDWSGDGKTFVVHLNSEGWNREWMTDIPKTYRAILGEIHPDSWYAERYEALTDASTQDEKNSVANEVVNRSVTLGDRPYMSGPYMLDSLSDTEATFTRTSGHWSAEVSNWDTFVWRKLGSGSNVGYQALASDQVDLGAGGGAGSSIPENIQDPESHVKEIRSAAGQNGGYTLATNYGGDIDPFLKKNDDDSVGAQQALVRQAIGHASSADDVLLNNEGQRAKVKPYEKAHGTQDIVVEQRFPDLYEQLPSYRDKEPEKAKEKLRRAGLSLESGTWMKPNGEPLTLKIQSMGPSRQFISTIVQDLKALGVNAEHRTLESNVLIDRYIDGSHSMGQAWIDHGIPESQIVRWMGGGWINMHWPTEYKHPPIGDIEGEPTETFNYEENVPNWRIESADEHAEKLKQAIWAFAYHLPSVPMYPLPNIVTVSTQHFTWPEPIPEGQFAVATEEHNAWYGGNEPWRELRWGLGDGQSAKES